MIAWLKRTAVTNQLRGLLAEYGVIAEKSLLALRKCVPAALEDAENQLTVTAREFISYLHIELLDYDKRVKKNEDKASELLSKNDDYQRLQDIPGIGKIVGRGFIGAVGDGKQFQNGRQVGAWLGLTPKQHASGEQSRMGGISKRGNSALRKQLIHGARAVIRFCEGKTDPLSIWLQRLLKTKHKNKVVVALANKIERMAWAVLTTGESRNPVMVKK